MMLADTMWFQFSVERFYKPMFENIQNKKWSVRISSAVVVWLLMGLFIALQYQQCPKQPWWAFYLYGLIIYGVYNMTNHAVLRDYSLVVSAIDTLWGSVLIGTAAIAVMRILHIFTRYV
jgi:uncharacterized membrane protein